MILINLSGRVRNCSTSIVGLIEERFGRISRSQKNEGRTYGQIDEDIWTTTMAVAAASGEKP
jgi:hypothetical protein